MCVKRRSTNIKMFKHREIDYRHMNMSSFIALMLHTIFPQYFLLAKWKFMSDLLLRVNIISLFWLFEHFYFQSNTIKNLLLLWRVFLVRKVWCKNSEMEVDFKITFWRARGMLSSLLWNFHYNFTFVNCKIHTRKVNCKIKNIKNYNCNVCLVCVSFDWNYKQKIQERHLKGKTISRAKE